MMLAHLGFIDEAKSIEAAIERVYANGTTLTADQGGSASTAQFCDAIAAAL